MKRPALDPDKHYFDQTYADIAIKFFESLMLPTGKWAGKPWKLIPWQTDLITDLYGWRRKDTGLRSFNKLFLFIPRKASKSTTAVGLSLFQLIVEPQLTGDLAPQIPLAGNSRSQAKQLFDICKRMVSNTPYLREALRVYAGSGQIFYDPIDGILKTISSDGGSAMGMDVSTGVVDELHTIGLGRGSTGRGSELYDALTTASGARMSPLIIFMTTAGVSLEDQTLWGREYKYAKAVESGQIDDETYLPYIYEASKDDDVFAPETWYKANPSLGYTVSLDAYKDLAQKAENDPAFLNQFKRLYLNVPAAASESWIPAHIWTKCKTPAIAIDHDRRCWLGADLASVHDLTSVVAVWEPDHRGRIDILHWAFLPDEGRREKEQRDMIPYEQLSKQNIVTFTPGAVTDYDFVKAKIVELMHFYDVQSLSIDRFNSTHLTNQLEHTGLTVIGVGQGFLGMNGPIKAVERSVYSEKLSHAGDRLMEIAVSNAVVVEDPAGNRKLDKSKSSSRIDPAVALCLAMSGLEADLALEGGFYGEESFYS